MPTSRARRAAALRKRSARPAGAQMGCGIDVVELDAFKVAMRRWGAALARRVFTDHERAYAERHRNALLHLAARFAAKEAVIKAMSQVEPGRVLTMKQIEVRNDRLGRPSIALHDGRAPRATILISLSHGKRVAVASAFVSR